MEGDVHNFTLENFTATNLEMDLGPRIFWDLLFGTMIFVAVVGNLIVLWIVIGKSNLCVQIEFFSVCYKSIHFRWNAGKDN